MEKTIESVQTNASDDGPSYLFDDADFRFDLLVASVAFRFVCLEDESDFFFCDEFSLHSLEGKLYSTERLNERADASGEYIIAVWFHNLKDKLIRRVFALLHDIRWEDATLESCKLYLCLFSYPFWAEWLTCFCVKEWWEKCSS